MILHWLHVKIIILGYKKLNKIYQNESYLFLFTFSNVATTKHKIIDVAGIVYRWCYSRLEIIWLFLLKKNDHMI